MLNSQRRPADKWKMNAALAAVAFAPGLAVGSFVNVVAARLPLRRSVVHPRSACMSCGNELAWHDNVPLLSYALLRGRCRSCGVRIGLLYPAVELATALLVVACFVRFGLSGRAVIAAFFCVVLVAVSAIDLIHRIIPNRIVVPAAALVPSLYLLARHGGAARKMAIPFGPFLALGSVIALFAGGSLLHAYWALFVH